MAPLPPERRADIDRVLADLVKPARWPHTHPVAIRAHHLAGEPVPHEEALAGTFVPFAEGDPWGPAWGTTWFHVTGEVPVEWAGHDVVLAVHLGYGGGVGFGAEGQVWIDGRPVHGISPNHREVLVAEPAAGGEVLDLHIEAAANPPAVEGDPGPLLAADPGGTPLLTLRRCRLVVVDRAVEALVRDWDLVAELATWVGGKRAEACGAALDRACRVIEAEGVTPDAVAAARAELDEALAVANQGPTMRHLAVGNSHLDTAWLWPLRETHRKAARTFSTAATLLDRHPDYRFAASQPQQLAWIRDEHPDLWERIRAHVAAGRFDVIGAMWVEPDCNLPSGESLIRQIVHGTRFFRDQLGVDVAGLWLPDVFGYSAALPQILRQCGIEWFVTQKISWNDTNRFPHHTFWWEGIDGSRIFTHFPPADTYSGMMSVPQLLHGERSFAQRDVRGQSLYLYGHGDGGGGPDVDMLARARRFRDLDGVGRVELTTATDAMARIRAEGDDDELPVWVGELYLELHRGTYTTLAAIKRGNRELELALRDAEMWSWAASSLTGVPVPVAALDEAWRTLLLHQFHDILPGSSIHWVHQDTIAAHDGLRSEVGAMIDRALGSLAAEVDPGAAERPVLVANPLPIERTEVVEVDGALHRVTAPACGWAVADLAAIDPADDAPVVVGDRSMENGHLRIEWDDAGLLTSIRHLPTGREALAPGRRGNVLQLLEDRPKEWDAWDIDREALVTAVDLSEVDSIEVVDDSPLRATVRVTRSFGRSHIVQDLRLDRGAQRLEVHNEVDWHEDHRLLKVAFPVDVRATTARYEIQLGHVERPTHRNTTWDAARFETCAHTWVDLSEEGFGVALLNDGKYGHDIEGDVMRISLLRSPTWPDPLADRGQHRFAYAVRPHSGSPTAAGIIAEAHAFNSPLRLVPLTDRAPSPSGRVAAVCSLVTVDDPGVVISAVKAADDGDGTIVRLHEAFGGRRRVTLRVLGATAAERTDPLERPVPDAAVAMRDGAAQLDLRPFELVTLRLR